MVKKALRKWILVGISFVVSFLSPLSVEALTSTQLYEFAQNNILFYNPDGTPDCGTSVSNGEYMGQQYTLTSEEILGLARMAKRENNCNMNAFKTELSLMANLYEKKGNGVGLVKYVRDGTWFATRGYFYDDSVTVTPEQLQAVKDVIIGGKRNLPSQIVEHDCFGDIVWVETDGVKTYSENSGSCQGTGLSDRSLYVAGKTKIHTTHQDDNEYYIFYRFAGGENGCGDPFGYFANNPPTEASYSVATSTNANYAGAQVWSDAQLQAIQANRAVYEEVANQFGFPWQVLATLHWRESDLQKKNPASQWDASKSEGVYQLHTWAKNGVVNYPTSSSITEAEFKQQTIDAAKWITQEMGIGDLNNPDNVKKMFYQYNGTSQYYYDKAIAMGFTEEQARNGEGSDYVMNRYDARRDPTSASMDPLWVGTYTGDNHYDPNATSERFGTFVKYTALEGTGGNMYCNGGQGGTVFSTAVRLAKLGNNNGTGHWTSDKTPSPEYQAALESYGAVTPCRSSGDCAPLGASCDQFVATVMIYSGADPNFPRISPPAQRNYMLNHPEKYQQIVNNRDFSLLQPGDILVSLGENAGERHIFFYGGVRDGVQTQIGASYNTHTGQIYQFWDSSWTIGGYGYLIFRLIQ